MLKKDNTSPTKEEFDLSLERLRAARKELELFLKREEAQRKLEVNRKMDIYSDYDEYETKDSEQDKQHFRDDTS